MTVGSTHPVMEGAQRHDGDDASLVIGFVNIMPDAALQATERQFRELVSAASQSVNMRLRLFALPEVPRAEAGRRYIEKYYEDIGQLWASQLDGLIVTGTEPRVPRLEDEPYWSTLTRLIDWAKEHTISTVWSCLAAHAAVCYLDGIERFPFDRKLSGVFGCEKVANHLMMTDMPARWHIPHSRYNGVSETELVSRGYRVLARSPDAGADTFVKQMKSLFVFFQGHPEYEPRDLLREYRRDVGRFLSGERDDYPEIPRGYLDEGTAAAFAAFRQRAEATRDANLLSSFPTGITEDNLTYRWHPTAVRLYVNWMSYLVARRERNFAQAKSQNTADTLGPI